MLFETIEWFLNLNNRNGTRRASIAPKSYLLSAALANAFRYDRRLLHHQGQIDLLRICSIMAKENRLAYEA
jgi:hypothetical protein